MPKWLKISIKVLAGLVLLLLLFLVGITLYITFNKAKVLKLVNTELNKNVDGTITIGDLHPQFFKGFPDISLGLSDVLVRDKHFDQHHHTLLDAKDFAVSINIGALLKGTISINHIYISNASINLYTDSTGYSNTSIFKKGPKTKADSSSSGGGAAAQLKKFSLTNVGLKIEDQRAKKLFDFVINDIQGKMSYPDSGWHASFHLDVTAKSMAFSTTHGSFIKNKQVEGILEAGYNESTGRINVLADALDIGDDPFKLNAVFVTKGDATFNFHLSANQLTWRNASSLLSPNITAKLNQFNIAKPIAVTAIISGSFGGGDPFLYVTADVRDNTVSIPGSTIDNCSFKGIFTNNLIKDKGFTDENSVIRLIHMNGVYNHLPFAIDTGSIVNLVNPNATGNFRSNFPVEDLNYLLGADVAKFSKGKADINLRYKADIVNYRINKPVVSGSIEFKDADIYYIPSGLNFKNTSLSLDFIGNDLVLSNIRVQTGRSVVKMEGRVNNFLNLYYDAPERILLTWNIRSTQLYLGEFLGYLGRGSGNSSGTATGKSTSSASGGGNSGNVINQLSNVLKKGNAEIHLEASNVHYFNFLATNTKADLVTASDGLIIKNLSLNTSGGSLKLTGNLKRGAKLNQIAINTVVSNVNVHDFFYGFNNFGLKDLTYQNLKGVLSVKAQVNGNLNDQGSIVPRSINGDVALNLKNAALINFKPITSVGKFAFPFRNLNNITIPKLDADFKLHGDKIEITPMQINSSILNIDVAGVYGLTNGTDIAVDIPLRNPKGDSTITDKAELMKKRYKGIVLHIQAKSDENGKVKIGLNGKRKPVYPE